MAVTWSGDRLRFRSWCPVLLVAAVGLACLWPCAARNASAEEPKLDYPKAKKVEQVDDYHGVKVADPYRWLEQTDSQDLKAWIEAENKVTFGYLERIPARELIKNRLKALWNHERYGIPYKRGGRYFFWRNDGLQNQNVWYTMKSLSDEPKLLLDPNKLSEDGTVALTGFDISEDGKLMAYGLSTGGSDWQEWRVREVETGKDREDVLKWIKFSSAAWTHDNQGFFYSRYDEPKPGAELAEANYFNKLCYHKLGTPQSADQLIYERKDAKEWGFSAQVTDDGRYLVISVSKGTDPSNLVFYKDLQAPDSKIVEMIPTFEAEYEFIDNDGTVFWFRTDYGAPRRRVVAIDITKPGRAFWKELIPNVTSVLQSCTSVGGKLIANYMKDATPQVAIFDTQGKVLETISLPSTLGTATGFGGRRSDPETFFQFSTFTDPGTIYRLDVSTGSTMHFRKPKIETDPDRFETKQVFYNSKDGTRVPMFIFHKKGIKLNGNNPTYLYGYGGFNAALTPRFSVPNLVWAEMGGVLAIPNLRGGGEYGKEWHDAGRKLKKQNVFDDFIAAAQWLIDNKYTSSPKLAIGGGSNGGLLVGACMTQRPDLFAAAVPAVGVMDMLRFHKYTIGWGWTSDYGSADNPEEFKALHAYSPLHNIKPGTKYPATLITTADRDDRVVPAHSFKFAAALQEAQAGPNPVLIRIDTKAGHGGGKPVSKQLEEAADRWAFLVKTLDMSVEEQLKTTPKAPGKP